jgi:hypothetical protein
VIIIPLVAISEQNRIGDGADPGRTVGKTNLPSFNIRSASPGLAFDPA